MTRPGRPLGLATAAVLAATLLAACTSSSSSKAPSSAAPTNPTSTASGITATPVDEPSAAVLKTTRVTGEDTTIAFTKAFVRLLYTHGINTRRTGKAGLDDTHRARLPITGGSATLWKGTADLARNTAQLEHSGSGLEVASKSLRVVITDIELTLGRRSYLSAELALTSTSKPSSPTRVRLFDLTPTQGATKDSDGTTMAGIRATLDPSAASALDTAFTTTIFTRFGSEKAGTVSITVAG